MWHLTTYKERLMW